MPMTEDEYNAAFSQAYDQASETIRKMVGDAMARRGNVVSYTQGSHDGLLNGIIFALSSMMATAEAHLQRFEEIAARLGALEAHGVKYCGVWQRSMPYRRGAVVTSGASMWVALSDAPEGVEPGATLSFGS